VLHAMAGGAAGMPTWARVQTPIPVSPSPRPSPSAPSPSHASPQEVRRRSAYTGGGAGARGARRTTSAPASRVTQHSQASDAQASRSPASDAQPSHSHGPAFKSGHNLSQQPQAWFNQGSAENAIGQIALGSGDTQRPVRGGHIKASNALSFTPPSRSTLRYLQGQSGAKQSAPSGGGPRSRTGPRSKSSTCASGAPKRPQTGVAASELKAASPGSPARLGPQRRLFGAGRPEISAPLTESSGVRDTALPEWSYLDARLDSHATDMPPEMPPASPWRPASGLESSDGVWSAAEQSQLSERGLASELQKENDALRALAGRLTEQLATSEWKARVYQSTAKELLASEKMVASETEEDSRCEDEEPPQDDFSAEETLELESLHRLADRALERDQVVFAPLAASKHQLSLPFRTAEEASSNQCKFFGERGLLYGQQPIRDPRLAVHRQLVGDTDL